MYTTALDGPMNQTIQLLQFFLCKEFRQEKQDAYLGDLIRSNLYVPKFPYRFTQMVAVTCWRKDHRFHKEVIEYSTACGESIRSPHMDIEPVTNSVLFRWHKHQFPKSLIIKKPTILTIRVILDWKTLHETYIMVEDGPLAPDA